MSRRDFFQKKKYPKLLNFKNSPTDNYNIVVTFMYISYTVILMRVEGSSISFYRHV